MWQQMDGLPDSLTKILMCLKAAMCTWPQRVPDRQKAIVSLQGYTGAGVLVCLSLCAAEQDDAWCLCLLPTVNQPEIQLRSSFLAGSAPRVAT